MMRLEEFKNQLIPVDYVYHVEYNPKSIFTMEGISKGETLVQIQLPQSNYSTCISFKGNVLKEFKAWYDSLNANDLQS